MTTPLCERLLEDVAVLKGLTVDQARLAYLPEGDERAAADWSVICHGRTMS